jgi:hypothetical protein
MRWREWNERIAAQPVIADEGALRAWLSSEAVTGYQQMLLVMERFGYSDHLLASASAGYQPRGDHGWLPEPWRFSEVPNDLQGHRSAESPFDLRPTTRPGMFAT